MRMTDGADLRRQIKARGFTQAAVAERLGLTEAMLSKALGGTRRFTVAEMDRLRALLAPPSDQLPVVVPARGIPVIGMVAAGKVREAIRLSRESIPSPDPSLPPNAVALQVQGDSMDLLVDDGQMVIVDLDDKALFPAKYYVVTTASGETTFKQFKADPARLAPCSSNPVHKDIPLGGEQFEIVGRVIWRAARM